MSNTKGVYSQVTMQVDDSLLPADRVSVLIAYPKALTGRLIANALSHNRNFNVAALVSSADAVVAFSTHVQIQIALIAATLVKDNDGLDVLRRLCLRGGDIRSIVLFETPDEEVVRDAFRFGAKGVFCISTGGYDLLCKCIQCVHDGQIWANSQELNWIIDSLRDSTLVSQSQSVEGRSNGLYPSRLSPREQSVVTLVAEGLTNRDIARALTLSENTIKNYIFSIFNKLGISSRAELLLHSSGPSGRVIQLQPRNGGSS